MSKKRALQKKNDIILRSALNGGKVDPNASELKLNNTNHSLLTAVTDSTTNR